MRSAIFETIVPAAPPTSLPLTIRQTTSIAGSLGKLALLLPATVALLSPFLLLADHLIAEPTSRQALMERPVSTAQLVIGLAFWAVLFAWPLKRLVARFARSREIAIAGGMVEVVDRGVLGRRTWCEPVASYCGVVHVVRSSVSGSRHEVLMLHPKRRHSVLVAACDRISEGDVRDIAALFSLPVIPASALYALQPISAVSGLRWPARMLPAG